ncbi:MAG TPA: NAD-dependent epimerase/dehydratase family protein [Candidatus Eisenbacteria bacterium]|nr:NAD-dependent epimerase/dehydratase family protein [Candidatus Eisenbacteria bacterium]
MKKILITGQNSYLGQSLAEWLAAEPENFSIKTISMRDDSWKKQSFSGYDLVFHVAGIAHTSSKAKLEDLYYRVNRDLALETAEKAKKDGVKQFIFISSILVYGNSGQEIITVNTEPQPSNFYGKSKYQAEQAINKLASPDFKVAVLRPPMIYGKNSKGNYQKLSKLVKKAPLFPLLENQRSMLHVDNFCQFVKLIIINQEAGLFFPQNKDYVQTSQMVEEIAQIHGKKIKLTRIFNPLIKIMQGNRIIKKLFGSLVYEKSMSYYDKGDYQIRGFKESIELSEKED